MDLNTGLYFVGRCTSPTCSYYNALTTLYIGRGKTFDFVKERRQCMCGQCFSAITDILQVYFYKCRWSYAGQLMSEEELSQDGQTSDIYYFPLEKQQLPWKWLKFSVNPETGKQSKYTQTDNFRLSAEVQTEEIPNEKEVMTSLMNQTKHYRDKYHDLKEALKKQKTE